MNEFVIRIDGSNAGPDDLPRRYVRVNAERVRLAGSALRHDRERGLCLGGHWELTNRSELSAALGLRLDADSADILAVGWRKWGRDLFDRLRGSFAILIHDIRSEETTLGRDVFGLEPLYYVAAADALTVANVPWGARLASRADSTLDVLSIADYVRGATVDKVSTFHHGLKRLPPASVLSWKSGSEPSIASYWALDDAELANVADEPVERFRGLFDRSVSNAVQECDRVGVLLSGGLDSSAIFAACFSVSRSDTSIESFTKVFEAADWDDGDYLRPLQEHLPHEANQISYERHNPLTHMPRLVRELDGPVHAYGLSSSFELTRLAAHRGVDVLLDGHGGDEIVSYGVGRLNEFARRGNWLALWHATQPVAAFHGRSRLQIFARYLAHVPKLKELSRRYLAKVSPPDANSADGLGLLPDQLAGLAGEERYAHRPAYHRIDHDERMLMAEAMSIPLQPHSLETLVLAKRAAGVETRMPFYDRDLAEFSFALPSEQKLSGGMTRAILRRSMTGRVPESLRLRTGKFDFFPAFKSALLSDKGLLRSWASRDNGKLRGYVRTEWLDNFWDQVEEDEGAVDRPSISAAWRIATLAMWLDNTSGTPRGLEQMVHEEH
jgi:asparagine synthase (glutamine-hydrolysing)